jgi:hypothetical protein
MRSLRLLVVIAGLPCLAAGACSFADKSLGEHPCDTCEECETCVVPDGGTLPICLAEPRVSQLCGADGNVHWRDSCGGDTGIAEQCPAEHAQCAKTGQSAACACTNHWEGAKCDECPQFWDSTKDCNECLTQFDPAEDCQKCLGNWDLATDCTQCLGNWDPVQDCAACKNHWTGTDCKTCPGNWDAERDCNTCKDHWTGTDCDACTNHWSGADCQTCPGNWDPDQDCNACKDHWSDTNCDACANHWTGADCQTCPGNWDSAQDCNACVGNWDPDQDCSACTNRWTGANCDFCPDNWDSAEDCNACSNHWEGNDCDVCPGNWGAAQDCNACETNWTGTSCDVCPLHWDPAENCDTCIGNWDPAADCAACKNHWAGTNCDVCPNHWDAAQDCNVCPGNWDSAQDCAPCRNHWTGTNCEICPNHWDATKDCRVCLGNWNPVQDCSSCKNHWIGTNCDLCPGGWTGSGCDTCVRYVDWNIVSANDGLSWSTAFETVQGGIDAAYDATQESGGPARCQVWVVSGTYSVYQSNFSDTLNLGSGVDVFGGFDGSESRLSNRSHAVTTLTGTGWVNHVVTAYSDSSLDGFVIQEGVAAETDTLDRVGGGMIVLGSNIVIRNCVFKDNYADLYGGGIFVSNSARIESCLFYDNTAEYGSALHVGYSLASPQAEVVNCVFTLNHTNVLGGTALSKSGDSTLSIVGSVFWNDLPNEFKTFNGGTGPTITYSDIEGGYTGAGNIDADPLFVDSANGDFRLSASSSCIDAADGTQAPTTDIDGNARVDDTDSPNTGIGPPWADMGAYEYQP